MKILSEIRRRILRLRESRRFRRSLFSLSFGVGVVLTYYLIAFLTPDSLVMHNQIVTVLFIIIAVLILFPARERILQNVLQRREFSAFFGRDFHHLDVVARQFTMDALVREIFPEFMQWLGVRHARMAILDPSRRFFRYHLYRNGHLHESRHAGERTNEDFLRALRNFNRTVHFDDPRLPPLLRRGLEDMGAVLLQPFVFRRRVLGFLALHEPVRHKHAEQALTFFGDKAGVSIQNNILSHRIIDSRPYDEELISAEKVRQTLHDTKLPDIPNFAVRRSSAAAPAILEFFPTREGRWYLVVLAADRATSAAGIILYGMLGHLYSYIQRETNVTMYRLLTYIKQYPEADRREYPVETLIAELVPSERTVVVLMDGDHFRVRDLKRPSRVLVSPGWRNFIELQSGDVLSLDFGGTPLLELR